MNIFKISLDKYFIANPRIILFIDKSKNYVKFPTKKLYNIQFHSSNF